MNSSTINRGNAARALLEHGGHAPWWFDLWGESGEYSAGGAVQREVTVEGDTVRLRPGAAIYRRDLRRVSGDVSVLISAGGIAAGGRVLSFELHLEIGSAVPEVTWDDSITWEDFGWPHLEANRTAVFFFRSTDGGKTWTGGVMYTYGPPIVFRGGALQRFADVTGGSVVLREDAAVYRLDLRGATGTVPVTLTAPERPIIKGGNAIEAELHFRCGAEPPAVSFGSNVTYEDFGGLWRLEANRVTAAAARSFDGGLTWKIGKLYTYKER